MSAYTAVKCSFKDLELLIECLREMEYHPAVFSVPVQLEDYHGKLRPQRAQIVIPRVQLSPSANDVGFVKEKDGTYTAIISEYDSRCTFTAAKLEDLKIRYNLAKVRKTAASQGMRLVGEKATTVKGRRNVQYVFEPRQ